MDGFDSSSKFLVSCKFALISCEPQMYLVGADLHFHVLVSQRSRICSLEMLKKRASSPPFGRRECTAHPLYF